MNLTTTPSSFSFSGRLWELRAFWQELAAQRGSESVASYLGVLAKEAHP